MANNKKKGSMKKPELKFNGIKRNQNKKKKQRKPMNPVLKKVLTAFAILFSELIISVFISLNIGTPPPIYIYSNI